MVGTLFGYTWAVRALDRKWQRLNGGAVIFEKLSEPSPMLAPLKKLRQHLLTGVSYAIPFIACGGILIAAAIAFVPMTATGPDFSHSPFLKLVFEIGTASFSLMLSVLAGYIAYSIAGKPGLVPGFIGGYLSGEVKAGFLGAILAVLLVGRLSDGLPGLTLSPPITALPSKLFLPL